MSELKKLRRGLKDVSPLFLEIKEREAPIWLGPSTEPTSLKKAAECWSVVRAERPSDSSYHNTAFAVQIAARRQACWILTLSKQQTAGGEPGPLGTYAHPSGVKHLFLTWEDWNKIVGQPRAGSAAGPQPASSRLMFLDFDFSDGQAFEKVIPILDKWIFLVRPSFEALTETLKMIKASLLLTNHLEYFVIFDGKASGRQAGLFFERFSEVAARRLGVNLGWLGPWTCSLALDALFENISPSTHEVEKNALAYFIQSRPAPPLNITL